LRRGLIRPPDLLFFIRPFFILSRCEAILFVSQTRNRCMTQSGNRVACPQGFLRFLFQKVLGDAAVDVVPGQGLGKGFPQGVVNDDARSGWPVPKIEPEAVDQPSKRHPAGNLSTRSASVVARDSSPPGGSSAVGI
jgi:hypothetical protein